MPVTVDGDLTKEVSADTSNSSIEIKYTGALDVVAGKINGTCVYDATLANNEMTGTICGYDISDYYDEYTLTTAQKEAVCKALF